MTDTPPTEEPDAVMAAIRELLDLTGRLNRCATDAASLAAGMDDGPRRHTLELGSVLYDLAAIIGRAGATLALTIHAGNQAYPIETVLQEAGPSFGQALLEELDRTSPRADGNYNARDFRACVADAINRVQGHDLV